MKMKTKFDMEEKKCSPLLNENENIVIKINAEAGFCARQD